MKINLDNHHEFKEIPLDDLNLLWYSNYWDGYLDGLLEYEGKKYWFANFADWYDVETEEQAKRYEEDMNFSGEDLIAEIGFYRKFAIIEISDKDVKYLQYWHDLFMNMVGGDHTEFENNKRKPKRPVSFSEGLRELYYQMRKQDFKKPDILNNEVIGWFRN